LLHLVHCNIWVGS